MPSSPQTVTTRGVFDYLYNSAGKAIVGATVNCTLNFNGSSVTSPIVNLGELQQSTVTDQNGFWRFNLVPNDTITPTGTLYTINAGNIASYDISVPSGGADVQSSSILANTPSVLSPAVTGLTGPITVTGNETVTGNLSVSGTTTLGSTTAGATTTGALSSGAITAGGDVTIASAFRLLFGAAVGKIVPGATSISHRNNADSADNVLITDAGAVTVRNGFTLTAGDAVVTAGRLLISAAAAKILGGATSLSLRNNADSADNVLVTDAGAVTLRNALSMPPSASGTVAATSYGSTLVKISETLLGGSAASVSFTSIPGGFRHLLFIVQARGDTAATNVEANLNFNGDGAANYMWMNLTGNNSAASSSAAGGTTNMPIAQFDAANSTAGEAGFGAVFIPNYASTSFNKTGFGLSSHMGVLSAASAAIQIRAGRWANTAAINRVDFNASAGNFITSSLFTLYGLP